MRKINSTPASALKSFFDIAASQIDWKNLKLTTRVNGELRQEQNTSELIVRSCRPFDNVTLKLCDSSMPISQFDIPTLIETVSSGITIQPGDVIATGTPGQLFTNAMV